MSELVNYGSWIVGSGILKHDAGGEWQSGTGLDPEMGEYLTIGMSSAGCECTFSLSALWVSEVDGGWVWSRVS